MGVDLPAPEERVYEGGNGNSMSAIESVEFRSTLPDVSTDLGIAENSGA